MKKSVKNIMTEKILSMLKNKDKWEKPFVSIRNMNGITKREYTGLNAMILAFSEFGSPFWLTFKQINDLGGKVKKGSESTMITYYKKMNKYDEEGEETGEEFMIMKYYRVFNIEQCENLPMEKFKINGKEFKNEKLKEPEEIVKRYNPKIEIGTSAKYLREADTIVMPKIEHFTNSGQYYSTLFHEMVHSTGSEKRLKRKKGNDFRSKDYAYEELIAELGSLFLSKMTNLDNLKNSSAYINSWIKRLDNNEKNILNASSQAWKACEYILNNKF